MIKTRASYVVLLGSLLCVASANAQTAVTLELVWSTSGEYRIEATITGGDPCEGLALWGADVNFYGCPPSQMAPPSDGSMDSFWTDYADPPGSCTHCDGLNNPAGYGGTLSGNILLQVGGAQNTINNDPGNAPYPVGAVVTGIGLTTITVAEGSCVNDVDTMSMENCFASVINQGESGPVFMTSAADVTCVGTSVPCGDTTPFTCPDGIPSTSLADDPRADVNCDNIVNGLDSAIVTSTLNWGKTVGSCDPPDNRRADVNRDAIVNGLDSAVITSTLNWGL